ncbi:MAG: hypothetical protein WCH99_16155 [Verrucomicrobiota bacterium]
MKNPNVPTHQRKITAAAARRHAAQFVLKEMFAGARVCDGSKARLCIYDTTGKLAGKRFWVVYPNPTEIPAAIRSSAVIVVCQRTGKILYAGSAQDEG